MIQNKVNSKVQSFILGLSLGFRSKVGSIKVFPIESFDKEKEKESIIYYANKELDIIEKQELQNPTHIICIRETTQDLHIKIYKKLKKEINYDRN